MKKTNIIILNLFFLFLTLILANCSFPNKLEKKSFINNQNNQINQINKNNEKISIKELTLLIYWQKNNLSIKTIPEQTEKLEIKVTDKNEKKEIASFAINRTFSKENIIKKIISVPLIDGKASIKIKIEAKSLSGTVIGRRISFHNISINSDSSLKLPIGSVVYKISMTNSNEFYVKGYNFGKDKKDFCKLFIEDIEPNIISWNDKEIKINIPQKLMFKMSPGNTVKVKLTTIQGFEDIQPDPIPIEDERYPSDRGSSGGGGGITPTPSPNITSLSSTSGTIGTSIDINGSGFSSTAGNNTVKFGSITVPSADITFASDTKLTVKVPAGIEGTVTVTVTVGTQISNSDKTFDVIPNITGFTPTTAMAGSTIKINGTGFNSTSANNTVTFDVGGTNKVATVNSASSTQLDVTIPVGVPEGVPILVTVKNNYNNQTSTSVNFTVVGCTDPMISTVYPNFGVSSSATSITIMGANFQNTSTVKVGTTSVTGITVNDTGTVITGMVPAMSEGVYTITVTNPCGPKTGYYYPFTVVSTPAAESCVTTPIIDKVSPIKGAIGTNVIIYGRNFSDTGGQPIVKFNGFPATNVLLISSNKVLVSVPVGATTGNVTIQNLGCGVESNGVNYEIISDSNIPKISTNPGDISPTSGNDNNIIDLTIKGTNFGTNMGVVFIGDFPVQINTWTDNQITVKVPRGIKPGTYNITVVKESKLSNTVLSAYTVNDSTPSNSWIELSNSGNTYGLKLDGTMGTIGSRYYHEAVWSITQKKMYIFTGLYANVCNSSRNDFWSYSPTTGWREEYAPTAPSPFDVTDPSQIHAMQYYNMVWNNDKNLIYIFGGANQRFMGGCPNEAGLRELWTYDPLRCKWKNLLSNFDVAPVPVNSVFDALTYAYWNKSVWDEQNKRMIITGGAYKSTGGDILPSKDLWQFNDANNDWSLFKNSLAPPDNPILYHSVTWDTQNNVMYMFGGREIPPNGRVQKLRYYIPNTDRSIAGVWNNVTQGGDPAPSAREFASIAWDRNNNKFYLFGGSTGAAQNDLYSFTPTGVGTGNWTLLGNGATARIQHSAVWDADNNRMYIFGGQDAGSNSLSDAWQYKP